MKKSMSMFPVSRGRLENGKIFESVTQLIGGTPLAALNMPEAAGSQGILRGISGGAALQLALEEAKRKRTGA